MYIKTEADLEQAFHDITNNLDKYINNILQNIKLDFSNLDSLIISLDSTYVTFKYLLSILEVLQFSHPDKDIQNQASIAINTVLTYKEQKIIYNSELYKKLISYKDSQEYKNLNAEKKYFFDKQMQNYLRTGINLTSSLQQELKNIDDKLGSFNYLFNKNIGSDNRKFRFNSYQLKSVPKNYMRLLPKKNNVFDLSADSLIEDTASLEETRKKFWYLENNIAYPANLEILNTIISLCDKKARILNYTSYSEYDIANQMAKTVSAVENFLQKKAHELQKNIKPKLKKLGVDKLNPWDIYHKIHEYKSNKLKFCESCLIPLNIESTVSKILSILENLFSIKLESIKMSLYDPEITVYKLFKDHVFKGYIILDIFYRPNKNQDVLEIPIISAAQKITGVSYIMASFDKGINLKEIVDLFHELGHSIHTLLGETELGSHAGTQSTRDFSEFPSQLLELLAYSPKILKQVTNYDDKLIKQIIKAKEFEDDFLDLNQVFYSQISLTFFDSGATKDLPVIYKNLYNSILTHVDFDSHDHFYLSFDHLVAYEAKYYSYLWSKEISIQIYSYLSNLDPEKFSKYSKYIISKGGSANPQNLIHYFISNIVK